MTERDLRVDLLNTLLTTPHRNLTALYPLHQEILTQDPRFYVRLAAWYADHGEVRDHQEMFVICLCLSQAEGHRDVGLALLRRLPPYQLARVVDFIKGHQVKRHVPVANAASAGAETATATPATPATGRRGRKVSHRPAVPMETKIEQVGLFVNVPRSMRTEIERYLREREKQVEKFDQAVLHARAAIKRLYAGLHIRPSGRAQGLLFGEEAPEGSVFAAMRAIRQAETPAEQARALVEHHIPYRVATSLVKQMSPTVLAALVAVMTPQEVINNIGSLKARGAFDNADVKALVEAKLEAAKSDKRVSAYKAKVAIEAANVSGELAEKLDAITEAQVKAKGRITRSTGLMIDKSGSMTVAIEVGRQLGAMISSICEAELVAYAFDTIAYPIEVKGTSLVEWEKALTGITAGGGTACGVAIEMMRRKGQRVEQIIFVTDEGENQAPLFANAYTAYSEETQTRPDVILVKVGHATNTLERACAGLGIAPSVFTFSGDYYALPNLIPLLQRPSMVDVLLEILEYPLPGKEGVMTGDMGVDEVSALDLAFVVDTTGSMTGLIASAQQRMIAMIDALLQAAEVSLQLGIVEYRDHPPQDQLPFRAYDFTADLDAARETLNGLAAAGGGDGPESVLDGVLAAVRDLTWRPHARRLAVLVGDSPPHGVGARGDGFPQGCPCGETIESVTAAAEEARVTLYALGLSSGVETSFGALSHLTGGEFFTAPRNAGEDEGAIASLQAILVGEFGNLAFDRRVLAARREHPNDGLDTLAEQLASNRPAVSAAVSRLGARSLLA